MCVQCSGSVSGEGINVSQCLGKQHGELRRLLDFELLSHLNHDPGLVMGNSFYTQSVNSLFFKVRTEMLRVLSVHMRV